jgi:hypothetical protein
LTKLVFNVQTTNFDVGKPCPAKIFPSREHWKSNLAFSVQLLRHSPKVCPACLSKIHHAFGENTAQPTSKNHLDGKPALTAGVSVGGRAWAMPESRKNPKPEKCP